MISSETKFFYCLCHKKILNAHLDFFLCTVDQVNLDIENVYCRLIIFVNDRKYISKFHRYG